MKKASGLLFIQLLIGTLFTTYAQSRIDGLNAKDIYAVRIIQQSDMGSTDERNINAEEDIKRIVYYLKKYNYRDLGLEEINDASFDKKWRYQIILNGWRDEVYIFENKVFIGKSSYRLPPGMIREFDRIFRDL